MQVRLGQGLQLTKGPVMTPEDVVFSSFPPEARRSHQSSVPEHRWRHSMRAQMCFADLCRKIVKETVDKFGKIDILVNNASYQGEAFLP